MFDELNSRRLILAQMTLLQSFPKTCKTVRAMAAPFVFFDVKKSPYLLPIRVNEHCRIKQSPNKLLRIKQKPIQKVFVREPRIQDSRGGFYYVHQQYRIAAYPPYHVLREAFLLLLQSLHLPSHLILLRGALAPF